MGAGLPSSLSTHTDRMGSLQPSVGLVPVSSDPSRQNASSKLVLLPVRDFEHLCRELCLGQDPDAETSFLTQFCRSVDSNEILVNAKSMLRDVCWGVRQKRVTSESVDHNPQRFADRLVMEGVVLATACYYGLRPRPDLHPAYVQELGDAAKSLLWRGEDTDKRRRWADGRALRHLGFALIGGYCNKTGFPVKKLHEVSTIEVVRDWMAGSFDLAPEGPVRKQTSSVPHWTIAPETAPN